jgi:hypothetical protein
MSALVNQLCEIMKQYSECLEEETRLLKENRFHDLRGSYQQKYSLNEQYTLLARQLIDTQAFKTLSGERRVEVRKMTLKLQSLLSENDFLMRSAEQSYDTVMDILLEAIRANQVTGCVYTVKGEVANSLQAPSAIALNKEL